MLVDNYAKQGISRHFLSHSIQGFSDFRKEEQKKRYSASFKQQLKHQDIKYFVPSHFHWVKLHPIRINLNTFSPFKKRQYPGPCKPETLFIWPCNSSSLIFLISYPFTYNNWTGNSNSLVFFFWLAKVINLKISWAPRHHIGIQIIPSSSQANNCNFTIQLVQRWNLRFAGNGWIHLASITRLGYSEPTKLKQARRCINSLSSIGSNDSS